MHGVLLALCVRNTGTGVSTCTGLQDPMKGLHQHQWNKEVGRGTQAAQHESATAKYDCTDSLCKLVAVQFWLPPLAYCKGIMTSLLCLLIIVTHIDVFASMHHIAGNAVYLTSAANTVLQCCTTKLWVQPM